ncbi:MAG TPA: tRNA pseudouridine(38-40) synthase TruA [Sulfurovum sp.]|nr:tRNA pseudouridine(38-40) synthase TruA [Sulfurovum sp.]
MYHHRLTVSYKGTDYYGWQDIGEGKDKPTLQANIQTVLEKIAKSTDCTIATASRTDAGVHAQGQVIKVSIPLAIDSKKLLLGMNSLLADDIRVLHCHPYTKAFNPNKDSISKEYHYSFCTDPIHNPLLNDSMAHITSQKPLDIIRMKEACQLFIGEHDFYSFAKRDTTMHSTLRTVISCELIQHTSSLATTLYSINIVGEGFLRYMVRYMVGALFALGKGEIELCDIVDALAHHKGEKLSAKAKARGLCLIEVSY